MDSKPLAHPGETDLLLFMEQEMDVANSEIVARHLNACQLCANRVQRMRAAVASYASYHERVLKPSLPADPAAWPRLPLAIQKKRSYAPWLLAAAAALFLIAIALTRFALPHDANMTELLAQSETAAEPTGRQLAVTVNEHNWIRPAILAEPELSAEPPAIRHVHALFVQASYNWNNPLSARSFAVWRASLTTKTDRVTVLPSRPGQRRSYRLHTTTATGMLRSVALTLNPEDLRPVSGDFKFVTEQVRLAESEPRADLPPKLVPQDLSAAKEILATPEDELRVFAALNAAAADDEDLDVDLDSAKTHVVVTVRSVPETRLNQIRAALLAIPRVSLRSQPGSAPRNESQSTSNTDTDGAAVAFRRELEARAGGPLQLQEIIDRDLEASSAALTQAHALEVLAHKFPPTVTREFSEESRTTLNQLQHIHGRALFQEAHLLKTDLAALLPPTETPVLADSDLGETTRTLDRLLNRLLAGTFSQSELPPMRAQINGLVTHLNELSALTSGRLER